MKPTREHATNTGQTYMITSATWNRRGHFRNERWARLLIDTLYRYRGSAYLLHEFVIMPDHIHVILTPETSLERAVQFIKGGFSFRAKRELDSNWEVWQKGFSDHRIRDVRDYGEHVLYIRQNPVRAGFCRSAEEFRYSSAFPGFELDPAPQGLKPESLDGSDGAAEAAPFQSGPEQSGPEQSGPEQSWPEQTRREQTKPDKSETDQRERRGHDGIPEGMPFQSKTKIA